MPQTLQNHRISIDRQALLNPYFLFENSTSIIDLKMFDVGNTEK